MSDAVLVAIIMGVPNAGILIWQVVKWWATRGDDRAAQAVTTMAEEAGILKPLQDRIKALEAEAGHREETRMSDNMAWARKCERLDRRVSHLEAQVISLGATPFDA